MSSAELTGAFAPGSRAGRPGFWQRFRAAIGRINNEIGFVKSLSALSVVGTLLVAYFQSLSAYENKVAAQAKDDLAAATQTFTEASSDLSVALTLQQHLNADFYDALPGDVYKNGDAYLTKDARLVYKNYVDIYAKLHQNYNLLARKSEIYLDWPSGPDADEAKAYAPSTDPISMSLLGAHDFDCEKSMPSFDPKNHWAKIPDPSSKTNPALIIDWFSAQHHVLAIEYCFDVAHKRMIGALEWASGAPIDATEKKYMTDNAELFAYKRPISQILRLNAFMSLAMSEIERIRVKYRPNGLICSLPGVSQLLSMIDRCTAIQTKAPWHEASSS